MLLRRLDPGMIMNLHDVVEKRLLKMLAQLESRLNIQVKEDIVEFHRYL